ncbi:hypothetical protein HZC21_01345 [Candidatus Peregrinibacteria bacterium]|nr:hypothetical protein [Candidatus Peregrinibacteria bacterium]
MNKLSKALKLIVLAFLAFSLVLPGAVFAQAQPQGDGAQMQQGSGAQPQGDGVQPQGKDAQPQGGAQSKNLPVNGMKFGQMLPKMMEGGNVTGQSGDMQPLSGDMQPLSDMASDKGKEMAAKGLSQMKKQTHRMQKPIKQMEKIIQRVLDAGYTVPQEVSDALAKAKTAVAAIENAADTDAAEAAMEDFNAFIDAMDMNMEALNMLANFPKILKQANKTLDRLNKSFEKAKKRLAQTDLNLNDAFAKVQAKIDGLVATLKQAEELAKSGNAEGAFTKLEDEFFENIEDAFQSVGMLDALRNLSKVVKMVSRGITSAEKLTAKLEKAGTDVSDLNSIIAATKAKLEEFKAVLASAGFDPETAVDIVEELNDLRADFENAVEELTDENLHGFKSINFFGQTAPQMPKGLMKGPPTGEPGASGFEKMEF